MDTLRFIATPSQAKKLNDHLSGSESQGFSIRGLEVEAVSLSVIRAICEEARIQFELVGADDFLKKQPADGISLLLDADVEPIVYSEFWAPPLKVDGSEINRLIGDKHRIYKMISTVQSVKQPKTLPLHNHRDLEDALAQLPTEKVVIKPRNSHSSKNVLILDKARLTNTRPDERLNFADCIVQEYLPESLWPPREWRLHFVGRQLCRAIRITDKNNWTGAFGVDNQKTQDVPKDLAAQAQKVAEILANPKSKENFTLDFLETKMGPLFLEANCGALGSFYIDNPKFREYLEPIFLQLFRKFFKKKILQCISK